ncbi:MAG: M15 family metallopeptidase [Acutalibacteraceae bacterium]
MKKRVKYEKVLKSRSPYHADRRRSQKSMELKFILFTGVIGAVVIAIWGIVGIIVNWHFFMQSTSTTETSAESSVLSVQEKNEKLLTLVNTNTALPTDYPLTLETYNNIQADSILISDLNALISAAEQDGITLKVIEGYISKEEQAELHKSEVNRLLALGYSQSQANTIAETTVPSAGNAEQQTGLSVRFDLAENSKASAWLERHSFKYGFILRYPDDKTETTDHNGDNTLFRYVGKNYALQMRTLNMCLEEYIIYLNRR